MPTRRLLVCAWFALVPPAAGAMQQQPPPTAGAADSVTSELVVRVLDVGQGDATYVANGSSHIIIDGGPSAAVFGRYLDSLGLNNSTIDVVVLSHAHLDHYSGLRELFKTSRNIRVRYFFENKDLSAAVTLARLRDSILARMDRNELVYRDTDDPCSNGASICTITMTGGARLHIMAPQQNATSQNNRSTPVKLVGPDSASFTMWLAGDAEHSALRWFESAGYAHNPGMSASVLKANHHGSCNGVTDRYLALTRPSWLIASLGAANGYGHMHTQAKSVYRRNRVPWYRTDMNGSVTIRAPGMPGSGFTITPDRGRVNLSGRSDRRSTQRQCR